ncbi:unnamed protein product [Sympodiomycopsis kandeliae]
MAATRPKLQARAITELGPLVESSRKQGDDKDLGRGTQICIGKSNITGGSQLPNGARVPVSPFLSLPAPPTAEDLKRSQEADATPRVSPLTQRPLKNINSFKRSTSNGQATMQKIKSRPSPPSSRMIRSISLPVATQKEFDEQCQAYAQRDQDVPVSPTSQWSKGWPTTPSFSARRQQRQQMSEHHVGMRKPMLPLSMNRQMGSSSCGASPKTPTFPSPLLPIHHEVAVDEDSTMTDAVATNDEEEIEMIRDDDSPESVLEWEEPSPQDSHGSYFAPKEHTGSSDSVNTCSDGISDGPATPRTAAPYEEASAMQTSLSKQQWAPHSRQDTIDDELNGSFIHPEHMTPPTSLSS